MKQKISSATPSLKIYLKRKKDVFQWPVLILLLSLAYMGCGPIHEAAQGSFDLINVNNKGVSYVDDIDREEVAADYGVTISEGILQGGFRTAPQHAFQKSFSRNNGFGIANVDGNNNFLSNNFANPAEKEKLSGSWYLSEALDFTNIRSKISSQGFNSSLKLFYLQIPVLINYSYPLDVSNSLHFGLGPYTGIGLFGNYKAAGMTRSIKFGSSGNSDDLKRMNYGLEFNAGFRFLKKWDAILAYQSGLRNVSTTAPDPDTKIRGLTLSVGYWFH